MNLNLQQVTEMCGGICNSENLSVSISGVSIDTRSIQPGDVFVALPGENSDGHDFIETAFQNDATAAIVSRDWGEAKRDHSEFPLILVSDPLAALQTWAAAYRKTLKGKLVAVTGTNGKTSTREMICSVLETGLKVEKTRGNLNNHIGLPLSILSFSQASDVYVVEMGANHVGEIETLCRIAPPDISMITNIGEGHIGMFGSLENIIQAKFEIFSGLKEDGIFVVNADDPNIAKTVRKRKPANMFSYAVRKPADLQAVDVSFDAAACPSFCVKDVHFKIAVPGAHIVSNALAAISIGELLGISLAQAAAGLEKYRPVSGRWTIRDHAGILMIDDAYNANPASVAASIKTFGKMKVKGRRIAVLGDMLELGDYSDDLHFETGAKVFKNKIHYLFAIGSYAPSIVRGAVESGGKMENCKIFTKRESLIAFLCDFLTAEDAVLFKGSRKIGLSEMISEIETQLAVR